MPSKLKAWFDKIAHLDHLNAEDHTLQRAFAVVIYHVIKANNKETEKEKQRFIEFFKNDFELDDNAIEQLHGEASQFDDDFENYLDVLKDKISAYPDVEMKLMRNLNSIVNSQNFSKEEFAVFDQVTHALFPNVA